MYEEIGHGMDYSPCDPSTCLGLTNGAALLSVIADAAQLVGMLIAVWALLLAWRQLKKAANTGRVQIVLALDAQLGALEDIRYAINHPTERKPDYIGLRRYVAVFERVGHALSLGEVSEKQVDVFYGHRFANLAKYILNSKDREVRGIVFDEGATGAAPSKAWEYFFFLWETLYQVDSRKASQKADKKVGKNAGKKWEVPPIPGRR